MQSSFRSAFTESFYKGALQPISVPPSDGFIPTLYGQGWTPPPGKPLVSHGLNPNQASEFNLKASAVTRAVGGMATHWTCACPRPHPEERENNPIDPQELDALLHRAETILDVTTDQYDDSIRHNVVLDTLKPKLGDRVKPLPLAVRRRTDNPDYVTWSGSDTVLGNAVKSDRFTLSSETRVTRVLPFFDNPSTVAGVLIRDLKCDRDIFVWPRAVVIACGAVGTPQILHNSGITPKPLGRYLTEQSLAFCQVCHFELLAPHSADRCLDCFEEGTY